MKVEQENLGLRRAGFSPALSLLMSAFALLIPPASFTRHLRRLTERCSRIENEFQSSVQSSVLSEYEPIEGEEENSAEVSPAPTRSKGSETSEIPERSKVVSAPSSQIKISKLADVEIEKEIRTSVHGSETPEEAEKSRRDIAAVKARTQELLKEMEEISSAPEEPPTTPGSVVENPANESFILLPSQSQLEAEREFVVTRINWLYRRQQRVFRFSKDSFMRVLPGSLTVKENWEYKDVFDVTVTDPENMIIRFYSGKEAQYLNSQQNTEILEILKRRSEANGHSFQVKHA
eukprot:TRINITY_DN2893_c0_g1_i2.p1 TRINITY_DN2893_c0_g1~~TRINITY_DN2893_c0_g1_i2.p1  ORF type:complete len:291 (+),score=58.62 TRINITY_DN2893_c0_g1_i2:2-874(+)